MKIRVLAILALFFSILTQPINADTLHHHVIVDSFSEGVFGQSELRSLPDAIVQKIIKNESVEYFNVEKRCETFVECDPQNGLSMRYYLPYCASPTSSFCLEAFEIASPNGSLTKANFIGNTDGRTYPANAARGLPEGSTPLLFQAPGINNSAGTDTYAVKLMMDAFMTAASTKVYVFDSTSLVEPYKEVPAPINGNNTDCTSWQKDKICGSRVNFADGQRVALTVRLPNSVTGWLNGRLKNPTLSIKAMDANTNILRVEAEPVVVPELNINLTEAEFNSIPNPAMFISQGITWDSVNAGNTMAIEWVKQFSKVMKDTASGQHTAWAFSTANGLGTNNCLSDKTKVVGLVTTNALAYSPGAPDFIDGFLNYRVGGLHFQPDGKTPNLGTYDLNLRSDVARCLYNFTNAPLSATVSVSYETGADKIIATSALSEKDGWLHLGAYGFTFSNPTLKVKLKGTPKSGTTTSNTSSNKSKQSGYLVTCQKGSSKKVVNTPQPACPYGWKVVKKEKL